MLIKLYRTFNICLKPFHFSEKLKLLKLALAVLSLCCSFFWVNQSFSFCLQPYSFHILVVDGLSVSHLAVSQLLC